MPIDPFASAFVLLKLADTEAFERAVRLDDAVEWFEMNELSLDEPTLRLWRQIQRRYTRFARPRSLQLQFSGFDRNPIGLRPRLAM